MDYTETPLTDTETGFERAAFFLNAARLRFSQSATAAHRFVLARVWIPQTHTLHEVVIFVAGTQ